MNALPNTVPTSQADKQMLLDLLRETRERFLRSFAGTSDEESRNRLAEGCWSVLDTVEHLAVAETFMLQTLKDGRRPRSSRAPNREALILQLAADRSYKFESPERARPTGRFPNLEAATKQFETSRAGAIRFVEESTEDLRATEVTHPHPRVGDVTAFEMLIIIAKHAERHAKQIEEIRNTLGPGGTQ